MDPSRDARLAENEAFFRVVNEHIEEAADRQGEDGHLFEFLCECADLGCRQHVDLTLAEYEAIRSDPARFVIAPGHEFGRIEKVVANLGDKVVVEKVGEAAQVAEALDPRAG